MPNLFSFDTETHLIQPGLLAPPLVCASVADAAPGSERLLSAAQARGWFREAIATPGVHLTGANLAYDLGVMCADDARLVDTVFDAAGAGRLHDVAIREALVDIARGLHGLDPETGRPLDDDEGARYPLALLVKRHLGLDISAEKHAPDAWRLRYAQLDGVPLEKWPTAAVDYPKRDARFTLDVHHAQERAATDIPNGGNLHAEGHQVRAALALHFASLWGLRTHGGRVAQLRQRVEEEWQANRARFLAAGIFRPDGTKDSKRLSALVSSAYNGLPPVTSLTERFPDGQVATDRDTLLDSGDPLLEELGKAGKVDKYRSTYLGKLEAGVTRPLNPRFNVLVSTTRVSSDYQQLPQRGGVRECHEARPGFVFCSVDYAGLELRTMAQRALWEVGWSRMAEALLAKEDVHTSAAATFLGESYAALLPRVKAKEATATSFRALAKIFNFGKGGGLGAGGMAYHARAKDGVRFCQLANAAEACGVERVPVRVQGKVKMVCAACVDVSRHYGDRWMQAWPEQRELFSRASRLTYGGRLVDVMIPGPTSSGAGAATRSGSTPPSRDWAPWARSWRRGACPGRCTRTGAPPSGARDLSSWCMTSWWRSCARTAPTASTTPPSAWRNSCDRP